MPKDAGLVGWLCWSGVRFERVFFACEGFRFGFHGMEEVNHARSRLVGRYGGLLFFMGTVCKEGGWMVGWTGRESVDNFEWAIET